MQPTVNNIVNLTKHKLTTPQIKLLNKGLWFVFTPKSVSLNTVRTSFSQFRRKMYRHHHFRGKQTKKPPFYTKSSWEPPIPDSKPLKKYLKDTLSAIERLFANPLPPKQNLSENEKLALTQLKNNKDIIIKRADKGNKIVLWPRDLYLAEAYKQLNDQNYYLKIDNDPTTELAIQIESFICSLKKHGKLDNNTADFLHLSNNVRTPVFYLLPKIHKSEIPPGRPIVSGCNSPTEGLSQYLDFYLKPIVESLPSYIKDTTHFLQTILLSNPNIPDNPILVTFDVKSLYTNIPHNEGIRYNLNQLINFYGENLPLSAEDLKQMFEFILKQNYFTFNNEYYLQTHGTSMGSPFAPSYANIFMGEIEKSILDVTTHREQPTLWLRFIDDIFMIWGHGENSLRDFHQFINSIHATIKFEMSYSRTNIPFLDTKIHINENKELKSSLYIKPTDNCGLLHETSFHPASTKRGIIYSQALRYRRVITDDVKLKSCLTDLGTDLLKRGYNKTQIYTQFNKVTTMTQKHVLSNNLPENALPKPLPFIVPYDPTTSQIGKIIKEHWHYIREDPTLSAIWPNEPFLALKRHKNIKDILVTTKFNK